MKMAWIRYLPMMGLLMGLIACSVQDTEQGITGETFNKDAQGWQISGNGLDTVPRYSPTGGNPGGYIFAKDVQTGFWYFVAPSRFVNQVKGGYGHQLRYELKQNQLSEQADSYDVILKSKAMVISYRATYRPGLTWTLYVVGLEMNGQWYNSKSQLATKAELQTVLDELDQLWIRGEFRAGPDEGGLDNVSFQE